MPTGQGIPAVGAGTSFLHCEAGLNPHREEGLRGQEPPPQQETLDPGPQHLAWV